MRSRKRPAPLVGLRAWLLCLLCALFYAGTLCAQSEGLQRGEEEVRTLQGVDEDARLEELIERRLAWDRELAPYRLEATVNQGVVNLTGTVSTQPESHRARRITEDTQGVLGVVNGLMVDTALVPFAGDQLTKPDDATLRERVSSVLEGDYGLSAGEIDVRVEDGRVVLSGRVPEVADQMRAGRIARSLYGVEYVENNIQAGREP